MKASQLQYCKPGESGLQSEARAVGRRIAKVLNALGTLNNYVMHGPIVSEAEAFERDLIDKLRAEGWRISAGDKWKVRPPRDY